MYDKNKIIVRNLGLISWEKISKSMYNFTINRTNLTKDELWLVQHPKIFTVNKFNDINKNFSNMYNIPIAESNRGGKITYHAPGQQIVYILMNLKRREINIRQLINIIQQSVIKTLDYFNINAKTYCKYPGVYVNKKKICSLGLKIIKGCSLHGFALNINMDMKPFKIIHPCGCKDLKMTQISDFYNNIDVNQVNSILISKFNSLLENHNLTLF